MKITVYVVTTCIPERGEKPCLPSVFGSSAEAEAYADAMLRAEWETHGPWNDDDANADPSVVYAKLPYPSDWRVANDQIAASFTDGSWGQWQLTSHDIEIAGDEAFNDAVEAAVERRMNEDLGAILEEHTDKIKRRWIEPIDATLRTASGAICALQDQIGQMSGMFSDGDGAMARAMKDCDAALESIKAVLA